MTLYPKLILDALATVRYPGNKLRVVCMTRPCRFWENRI